MARARSLLVLFLAATQLFVVAASVMAFRTRPQGLIASDGKGYYAWLRSLALDGDVDFRNDYELIYPPDPVPEERLTPRGRVLNIYPVGLAAVEIPGFVVGHLLARVLGHPPNGVSPPYQFAVTLWLQLLCLAGLALLFLACVRLGADPMLALLGVVSTMTATNLVQYVARPAMAHGPGLAILCVALYLAVVAREPGGERWKLALLGAMLGLALIIRATNVALAPFFAVLVLPRLGRSLERWTLFLAPFLCMIALQVTLMSISWGQLTFSGYGGMGFTSGITGIIGTLFTSRHGLFVYHPWYLVMLALTVAALFAPATRALAAGALVSFVALAIINGTWWSWWFGHGFGNRAFVETIPVLLVPSVLHVSRHADRMGRTLVTATIVVALLSAANALLWTGFVLRRYPPDGFHSAADAYLWPWRS